MKIAVMPIAVHTHTHTHTHTGNLINKNTSMSNALLRMHIKDG